MNQKINSENIENILFWDLEVVRKQEELDETSIEFELFRKKNRNRDSDELLSVEETKELYKRKGGLNMAHNKIVCLSMGFVKNSKIYVKSLTGEQSDIIKEFSKVLNKDYIPCGYNIVKFDFPMLRAKAFEEKIYDYSPENFNDSGKKEWALTEIKYKTNIIDLMLVMQGTHYVAPSLEETCYLLNVDTPKSDIDGSQVSDIYYAEGVDRIASYCERDVVACIHILQRMRGEEPITDIVYKNDVETKSEKSILTRLYDEGYLSKPIKEKISEILNSKKKVKSDKKHLQNILEGIYIKSAFSTTDSKATDSNDIKESKILEIQEFLNEHFD